MDELLTVFRNTKAGILDSSVYTYENINVINDGKGIMIYDVSGTQPCGKYRIPDTEEQFIAFIEKMNTKVGELIETNSYICGKCGKTHELPEEVKDRYGNLVCSSCINGGDIREVSKSTEDTTKESPIPSTVRKVTPPTTPSVELTIETAVGFLVKQGFEVMKKVPSYRVVFSENNDEKITSTYYRDQTAFENDNPGKTFIDFVRALKKTDLEPL